MTLPPADNLILPLLYAHRREMADRIPIKPYRRLDRLLVKLDKAWRKE